MWRVSECGRVADVVSGTSVRIAGAKNALE